MIRSALGKVAAGIDLAESEMMAALGQIADGRAGQAQIGAFLTALRIKGETEDEIAGAALVLRSRSTAIPLARTGREEPPRGYLRDRRGRVRIVQRLHHGRLCGRRGRA